MYIDKMTMEKLNDVQQSMFEEFIELCTKLNLKYYIVHGTLLGALRYGGFFPMDDDIDVAMPREDYNKLVQYGQKYLPRHLFIQTNETDSEYPLAFAKIRNTDTAFIQPVLDKCKVNKGIYIDIFPIDTYPDSKRKAKKKDFLCRIYNLRVSTVLNISNTSVKHKIYQLCSKLLFPSWRKTVYKYINIYNTREKSTKVILFGGKISEVGIPAEWFKEIEYMKFNGIMVKAPKMYDEYLTKIYGDYMNYSPSQKYLNDKGEVEISADILDFEKSYIEY